MGASDTAIGLVGTDPECPIRITPGLPTIRPGDCPIGANLRVVGANWRVASEGLAGGVGCCVYAAGICPLQGRGFTIASVSPTILTDSTLRLAAIAAVLWMFSIAALNRRQASGSQLRSHR